MTIDSLRADLPWTGYPRDIAPRLTELASRCVTYERAYATASHTAPSLGSILQGKYASELKRDGYFSAVYPPHEGSVAAIARASGVETVSAHAHDYLRRSGLSHGFSRFELVPGLLPAPNVDPNKTSKVLFGLARSQLDATSTPSATRRLAWYHFVDPHALWLAPSRDEDVPHFGGAPRDLYDAEVFLTDKYVGKLLDHVAESPRGRRTAIVVTADHGEGIGDHGQAYHGYEVWEALVRVPLIVCIPGTPPRRISTPRSLIDLGPTILDLLGLPPRDDYRGKSLVPEVLGAELEPRDVIVDMPANDLSFERKSLIDGRWKATYVGESGRTLVYDLENDPKELHPLRSGPDHARMASRLAEVRARIEPSPPLRCGRGCAKGWR
ncbi:MAG: sulfatase [Myxococcales bacterium]|nr:sulfatase [Myxococcales bacterium]